ncbi:Glucosamine-6-phosphate isomerase 2 [Smittium mucronatum]|uniref:glucosamine-6-phosphate deaminase n=1 Tax=Smittium mucronatum TaxID=133383 RepID=A0A1R0GP11_9FUNG|nr:Glucosamine-6-phosphate isomerase 2 [Smittium mucronatum]
MRLVIKDDEVQVAHHAAVYVSRRIIEFSPSLDRPFVLGILDDFSLVAVYRFLSTFYREGLVSFENVIVFISDEFVGLPLEHPASNYTVLKENLFKNIDIKQENIFSLNGKAENLTSECINYEKKISEVGGIELILGSVQPDGHVAFNEPGSSLSSNTRIKTLAYETVLENARFFGGDVEKVPKLALTMGINTVLESREIVIIMTGAQKSLALSKCVEGGINHMWIVSAIQLHPSALIICDEDATLELLVKTVRYFKNSEKMQDELAETYKVHLDGSLSSTNLKRRLNSHSPPGEYSIQVSQVHINTANQVLDDNSPEHQIDLKEENVHNIENNDDETDVESYDGSFNIPNTMVFIGGHRAPIESNSLAYPNLTSTSLSTVNPNVDLNAYPRLWWEHMDQFSYFYNAHFVNCHSSNSLDSNNINSSVESDIEMDERIPPGITSIDSDSYLDDIERLRENEYNALDDD